VMPESHFLACIHPRTWFVVKCFSFFLAAAAVLSVNSLCVRRAWWCRHAVVYPGVCGDYVIGKGGVACLCGVGSETHSSQAQVRGQRAPGAGRQQGRPPPIPNAKGSSSAPHRPKGATPTLHPQ